MEVTSILHIITHYVLPIILLIILIFGSAFTVKQGTAAVITRFGKFLKVSHSGLNFKIPILDNIYVNISLQNMSIGVKFQAITSDQANVYFTSLILYSVKDSQEDTIKQAAFKFRTDEEFKMALNRSIEGLVREYVSDKTQSEILKLRSEIVDYVKSKIDGILSDWGYHLIDLKINDINFDEEITQSMAKVVASSNLKLAATNEGDALLIKMTKEAEANGKAIIIQAQSEKDAAKLRGEGISEFRKSVSQGLEDSAKSLSEIPEGVEIIKLSMWLEGLESVAKAGNGHTIFLDGSTDGMKRLLSKMD